jgi:hypothetical protein
LRHGLGERLRERRVLLGGWECLDRAHRGLPGDGAVGEQGVGELLAAGLRLSARGVAYRGEGEPLAGGEATLEQRLVLRGEAGGRLRDAGRDLAGVEPAAQAGGERPQSQPAARTVCTGIPVCEISLTVLAWRSSPPARRIVSIAWSSLAGDWLRLACSASVSPPRTTRRRASAPCRTRNNFYRDVWRPAKAASGIDCSPHDFRHSWVTNLAAAGLDEADLADVAGHGLEVQGRYRNALRRSFDAIRSEIG